ncbi:MAG TPA: AAA family ATPase [Mucilaginibacter sp.]|nr:AAA family ATPase [Mucilaginibacter sp.]
MTIWKLGCHWGSNTPSFYEFIKTEKIVIGHTSRSYNVSDIVIITEGHNVKAIVQLLEIPKSVTSIPSYKEIFEKLEIEYIGEVTYAKADWFELPKKDQFTYQLTAGIRKVQMPEINKRVLALWKNYKMSKNQTQTTCVGDVSLNTILYGPPGTGKTYNIIKVAAELISDKNDLEYDDAKKIYNEHLHDQIEFIAFHQNYSYEEFIQGLRPDTNRTDGQMSFFKKDGIFKRIADKAFLNWNLANKITLPPTFEEVFEEFFKPVIDEAGEIPIQMESKGFIFYITKYNERERNFNFRKQSGGTSHTLYVPTLKAFFDRPDEEPTQGLKYYYIPLAKAMHDAASKMHGKQGNNKLKKYVLIIDEINRANISRVFGELITLIEDDKRWGNKHQMELLLPSEDKFVVPNNLYILGTMNTADKSIALLDIALRRRFNFISMFPIYDTNIIPSWSLSLLSKLNEKIYTLKKSPDFFVGHAFFIDKEESDLKNIFNQKIIPLLMEYFQNNINVIKDILTYAEVSFDEPSLNNNYQIKIN